LNELIYLFDVEHILLKRFEIEDLTKTQLKARCYGEKIEPSRHKLKTGVKAATYYMLSVDRDNNGYKVQIIFDV
jgi:SHS2 domain-containing protein